MFGEVAEQLLSAMGKPLAERGVITPAQLDDALARLEAAVALERAAGGDADDPNLPLAAQPVGLRRRAFPLLEMLRAARRKDVDVTWGI